MSLIHNHDFKWYLVRDNFLTPEECESQIQHINNKVDEDEFVWGSLHNCKNVVTTFVETGAVVVHYICKLGTKVQHILQCHNFVMIKFDNFE